MTYIQKIVTFDINDILPVEESSRKFASAGDFYFQRASQKTCISADVLNAINS